MLHLLDPLPIPFSPSLTWACLLTHHHNDSMMALLVSFSDVSSPFPTCYSRSTHCCYFSCYHSRVSDHLHSPFCRFISLFLCVFSCLPVVSPPPRLSLLHLFVIRPHLSRTSNFISLPLRCLLHHCYPHQQQSHQSPPSSHLPSASPLWF